MFGDKRLSILGDSISTYMGVSNDSGANRTIGNNPFFYYPPFPLEKTYWMRLINELGMKLCVNNSWSGGNLSGRSDPDSGVNRACSLARSNGEKPDHIIVFMGINDLGRGVKAETFAEDYARTLAIIKENYPKARVCCVNLPDRHEDYRERTVLFNGAIARAAAEAGDGFFIADLFNSRLNNHNYLMNTFDGLHPDAKGAEIISEVVIEAFKKNC